MRRRGRTDLHHAEIVATLRQCGIRVVSLAGVGGGVPDLLCWHPRWGLTLVEIKAVRGRLSPAQRAFARDFPVHVVRTPAEALRLFHETRRLPEHNETD